MMSQDKTWLFYGDDLKSKLEFDPVNTPFFNTDLFYACENPLLIEEINNTTLHKSLQPRSIPFVPKLFPPHFGCICEVSVHALFQNHDFHFSPLTPLRHTHQNHQTWPSPNPTKINSFCPKLFTPHFRCICEVSVEARLFQNHEFHFSLKSCPFVFP